MRKTKYNKKRQTSRRKYKTRKNRKSKKGGNNEKCSMCESSVKNKTTLIPSGCLQKHGKNRAHKICDDCWWNKFAKEGVSHKCPGCEKGLPLNETGQPNIKQTQVIDLTEDDE